MQSRRQFVGGNWKSNNTRAQTKQLIENTLSKLEFDPARVDVVVAPSFHQLSQVQELLASTKVQVAAQNCSLYGFGAYTGQVSVQHLKDYNIPWVIIGHSQRRTLFGETDQIVADKIKLIFQKGGVNVIACFGETLAERQQNNTASVCERQLDAIVKVLNQKDWDNVVLAYQPVWAIGTGKVATVEQVQQVHSHLRGYLQKNVPTVAHKVRIIYGGSVTDKNSLQLIKVDNVDGFLVGGASLKPGFADIVKNANSK